MNLIEQKTFNIQGLNGISDKTISEHLKLYAGYVKHSNLIISELRTMPTTDIANYATSEARRRLGFEYGGVINHELYFSLLEGGKKDINKNKPLFKAVEMMFGNFEMWFEEFKKVALTRGVGWAMLSFDPKSNSLINHWVDEQHLGQLPNTTPIIALDMWEHSYMLDYLPSEKSKYIDSFLDNINWEVAEKVFDNLG